MPSNGATMSVKFTSACASSTLARALARSASRSFTSFSETTFCSASFLV